jgi:hypothetical protein
LDEVEQWLGPPVEIPKIMKGRPREIESFEPAGPQTHPEQKDVGVQANPVVLENVVDPRTKVTPHTDGPVAKDTTTTSQENVATQEDSFSATSNVDEPHVGLIREDQGDNHHNQLHVRIPTEESISAVDALSHEEVLGPKSGTAKGSASVSGDGVSISAGSAAKDFSTPASTTPTEKGSSTTLFSYPPTYYLWGAMAAGLVATVGSAFYIWGYKRSKNGEDPKENGNNTARLRRLHTRDWHPQWTEAIWD